jgi:hypothetical protein
VVRGSRPKSDKEILVITSNILIIHRSNTKAAGTTIALKKSFFSFPIN